MNNECGRDVTQVPAPTPDNSVRLNSSVLNEIFLGADGSRLGFAAASTLPIVNDDVTERGPVFVQQLNGKIIQPRLFILPANSAVLIKRAVK
ncbi:MAG: hypothetical protein QOG23_4802 [Blastocatellia bacterium]|nr:hypothetical protein [Blastocatellia bacterium]